jgi:hypothetical protein
VERHRVRPLTAAFAVVLTLGGAGVPAAAEPSRPEAVRPQPSAAEVARARQLFAQAQAAADAGRWREAIEGFEKVRAIKETPGVVFHLAAALEGSGRLARALEEFERSRDLARTGGVADVLDLADGRIRALAERVPSLVVRVPRPGESADVRLDGTPVAAARWGETLRVDPGAHRVEATVAGSPFVRELDLPEGAVITVVVGDAAAPAVAAREAPPSSAPVSLALPETGLAPLEPAPQDDGIPVGPLVLGAGGVALGVGGLVAFLVAGGENDAAAEACATADGCDPGRRDTVRTLDGVALGLWIGGALALGGSAAWWAVGGGDSPVEARLRPLGADVQGRF